MPQDTAQDKIGYFHNGDTVWVNSIDEIQDPQVKKLMKEVVQENDLRQGRENEMSTGNGFLVVFLLIALVALPLSIRLSKKLLPYLRIRKLVKTKSGELSMLFQYKFPYFNRLTDEQKQMFIRRVITFRDHRKFIFDDMPEDEDACYLISACAVQLTFGLKDYLMEHFKTIHIMRNEYRHFQYSSPFEGHTSDGEIYFSWPHFQYGYSVQDDKSNVGLHEMAHALTWQCFYSGKGGDKHFHDYFSTYSRIGRPLFNRMQNGEKTILGDYAATSYDEFWATSVEVFFEQPQQMKTGQPELYKVMCNLLNQHPAGE